MPEILLVIVGILVTTILGVLSGFLWNRRKHRQYGGYYSDFGSGGYSTVSIAALLLWLCIGSILASGLTALQYSTDHYTRLTYQQFYNGVETSTEEVRTWCRRDGACIHTYKCDPYIVHHDGYYTGTGKHKVYHLPYDETEYHSCPYEQWESDWIIHTTIGDDLVASHWFPEHPEYHEWRLFSSYPSYVGSGTPREILIAQHRIDIGDPRPATGKSEYTNFIFASDNILLKVPDEQVQRYRKARLLPPLATDVIGVDQARKAFFEGFSPDNVQDWEDALMRLNMEAGSINPVTRRFDIQLVAVNVSRVPEAEADQYVTALNAYWEDPKYFRKSALPKNDAVVVVGTDGHSVSWARGFTLIRQSNGVTWANLAAFVPGTAFTPQDLIGLPRAQLSEKPDKSFQVQIIPGHGKIEDILLNGPHPFVRPHMTDHHPGSVGFNYLEGEILPDVWSCIRFLIISIVVSVIVMNLAFRFIIRRY